MLNSDVGLCGLCLFGTQGLPLSFISSIREFMFYYVWRFLRRRHGTDVEYIKLSLYDHSAHYDLGSSSTALGGGVSLFPWLVTPATPLFSASERLYTSHHIKALTMWWTDSKPKPPSTLPSTHWTALCVAVGGVLVVVAVYSVVFLWTGEKWMGATRG